MRSFLIGSGLVLSLLAASPAQAQFANKSLGLSLGYMRLNESAGLDWGIPLGGFVSVYLESGFEWYLGGQAMILRERISNLNVVALAPDIGIRYLFLQEKLRPYVGLDIGYLFILRGEGQPETQSNSVGLSPNLGIDFFISDAWSLGVRGQFNLYLTLQPPFNTSFSASGVVATYF